jgi:hypothetical protein
MRLLSIFLTLTGMALATPLAGAAPPAPAPAASAPAALPRIVLSAAVLKDLPRRTVTVNDERGVRATYSGVDLGALVGAKGAPQDGTLRGEALADYVLVVGSDGYRAAFALAELDPTFSEKIVLLADTADGKPLGTDIGPYRLVIPGEKLHARWVRNVVEVDVLAAPPQAP